MLLCILIVCNIILGYGKSARKHQGHKSSSRDQSDANQSDDEKYLNFYPHYVPHYPIRVHKDGKIVTTGRMRNVGGIPALREEFVRRNTDKKVTLDEFNDLLQCSETQPIINSETGTYSMMQLIKPTKELLELACIWGETRCTPWQNCQALREKYNKGEYPAKYGMNHFDGFQTFRLVRIINNTAYLDWPWGDMKRVGFPDTLVWSYRHHLFSLDIPLRNLIDFPDVAFFYGGERSAFPWNFPFPAFTLAPMYGSSQMAWPWMEGAAQEYELYKTLFPHHVEDANGVLPEEIIERKNKRCSKKRTHETIVQSLLTSSYYYELTNQLPWEKRIPKAAFFGSYDDYRLIVFEQGRLHPELIDTSFSVMHSTTIKSFHPLANVSEVKGKQLFAMTKEEKTNVSKVFPPGYALGLANMAHHTNYRPGHYKYVVTMLGMDGLSTSGRIAGLLAHSGAVVMLSKSKFYFHFSAHFKPWVHYVPLSYSGADLPEKVRWLQSHEKMARQIAENGKNFARSYLRLEDYFCYTTTTLASIAELMEGSDVLEPFHPIRSSP